MLEEQSQAMQEQLPREPSLPGAAPRLGQGTRTQEGPHHAKSVPAVPNWGRPGGAAALGGIT